MEEDSNGAVHTNYMSLLFTEERDFLIRSRGEQVKAADILNGKIVGLYFSAHWCGPCRRFTPKLVEVYKEIADMLLVDPGRNSFEVVFISKDKDEESFKEYFKGMPWLAVPYSDSATREQLNKTFKVQGIPTLVILEGKSGAILHSDAFELVDEYGSEVFPFTKERLEELKEREEEARRNQTLANLLATPARDYLISNSGTQVSVATLEGKMVGLYFSDNRYGRCRNFTPKLLQMHSELKQREEPFEVVLLSLDHEEEDYKDQIKDMPWLALPFNDQSRDKLIRYFNLQMLPTLVLIGADGKTISTNVAEVVEDHGIAAYPFSPEKMSEIAEVEKKRREEQTLESILVSDELDYVVGKDGIKVPVKELVGKTVLIYFSAHWCPPCRAFTPKLVEMYSELKAKQCEVVFVSSDMDKDSFDGYYSSMPWLSIPFGDKRKGSLSRWFKVKGIPTLVAIAASGRTITTDAKVHVMDHGANAFPFTEERIKELNKVAEEIAKSWPEKVKHEAHKHELVKTLRREWTCDKCNEDGNGWSYWCKECDFDMHPNCALKLEDNGENQEEHVGVEGAEDKGTTKEEKGYVCDGDVCRKV